MSLCGFDWASTTLSLNLCLDFMESMAGQAFFISHFSKTRPIIVSTSVDKLKLDGAAFISQLENLKFEMDITLG